MQQALAGNFKPHHSLIVSHILAHLDYLDEAIGTLTAEVEQRLATFARKAENLCTINGVAARVSQVILAELGPDMTRSLPTVTQPAGSRSAPATTNPPANAAPAAPARATLTYAPR